LLKERYLEGGIGYKESKELLIESLDSFIEPFRKRRSYYEKNPEEVEKVLKRGADETRKRAKATMDEVRRSIGISILRITFL
jgi:tryptophanyl-tRNA synthetase